MRILGILLALILATAASAKMPYDAVCVLKKPDGSGGSGTLVVVADGKGVILTEAHVVPTVTELEASWPAYNVKRTAKPIYVSYLFDTALLVVDLPPGQPVAFATAVSQNEEIYQVGFPWYSREKMHWQKGILQDYTKGRLADSPFEGIVSCRPAGGMSGGAVFNANGALIGTVSALWDKTQGKIILNSVTYHIVMSFADPGTWRPITNHLRPKSDFKFAEREATDLTEPYDESTAPDLTVKTKASN